MPISFRIAPSRTQDRVAESHGLREGEVAGLNQSKLDRKKGAITLDEQIQYHGKGRGYEITLPRAQTDDTTRGLGTPPELIGRLLTFGDPKKRLRSDKHETPPAEPNKMWEAMSEICDDAKMPSKTFLPELGCDLATISSILGHSRIDATLIYTNVFHASRRTAPADCLPSWTERRKIFPKVKNESRL